VAKYEVRKVKFEIRMSLPIAHGFNHGAVGSTKFEIRMSLPIAHGFNHGAFGK
jgi:beta-glucanase (GH16 family)